MELRSLKVENESTLTGQEADMLTSFESNKSDPSSWFLSKSLRNEGVVLITHGLNQNPESWSELIAYLNNKGFHVYRLALKGHRGKAFSDMSDVTAEIWLQEMMSAYKEIRVSFPSVQVFLIAYSLGGLLATAVQLRVGKPLFKRQVLLAPALAIRAYTKLIIPLTSVFSYLPSRSQEPYIANRKGTTAAAYRALFQLEKEVLQLIPKNKKILNRPTRILMRVDDELISYKGTERLLCESGLDRWNLVAIPEVASDDCNQNFKHLIVDSESVGRKTWTKMTSDINSFFLGKKSIRI